MIVNADDWGYDRDCTDRALESFLAGGVTSASALVLMSDSERAAELARANSLAAIGLHLNLTEPYRAAVAGPARERQARVVGFFARRPLNRWLYNPLLRRDVRDVVCDQLEAFRALYGREPDHVDGHQHVHVSPNVLLAGAIPAGMPLRRSFTFFAHQKPLPNRAIRALINAYLARRHPTTDYFFEADAHELLARIGDARASVELMTHPVRESEYALLRSERWRQQLARWRPGTFSDLPAPAAGRPPRS